MEYRPLLLIKGDGIGPEIVSEAMLVLDKVGEKFGHNFGYSGGRSRAAAPSTSTASRCRMRPSRSARTRIPFCSAR